jgi:signal transduction histidine kinase
VINRYAKKAKSSLITPLVIRDKAIGTISMDNTEQEDAFTESDVRLLETIAANLAVAIDNTYLQESLKQELEVQSQLIMELEAKNAELERFTYTASHDLKSPLITIRGFLGYLEKDALEGNSVRLQADIQRISDATDRMHRLLTELLELSRIGRTVNALEEIRFEEIIEEALKRVEGQLNERQIKVEVETRLPLIFGDRERLIEVVQNLVDNACKFTKDQPKPWIRIGSTYRDGENVFFVSDNGAGIKQEYHEKVFGLFDKLDPTSEGTGIGLALVKRIIEVHGGRVWVESDGPDLGATFCFTLPSNKQTPA